MHALCEMAFDTKSVTQTQRNYRTQFYKQPPSDKAIRDRQRRFLEPGSVRDRKRSGGPDVSNECAERIPELFVRSPSSSNTVWTFFVLSREPTSRSTEISKKLPEFHYNCLKPHMASPICLRHNSSKPRRDFVNTLYSLY
jgi:hypothetical protein